jgi:hypothetical protein
MKTVTTSLAISSLLFPLFLFAQTTTTTSSNFCEQLDTILMRLDSQSISVQAKALPKNNSAVKNDVLLGNIAAKRTEVETAKQVLLNELQVRVKTSKQQTALEKFALDARNATLAKNEALDQLIKNNESQILETLKLRDLEVNKAVNTLKATLEASKVRARADCASGIPPQTARTTLRTSVEKALATFKSSIMSTQNTRTVPDSKYLQRWRLAYPSSRLQQEPKDYHLRTMCLISKLSRSMTL